MRRSLIPDIVNLKAFECASRHLNFSRAAEELDLAQSAVSRQIRDLERQTGLKLFERVRQRVVLTDAGQRLLPQVRDLLLRSERLMTGAVTSGRAKLTLKVATTPAFGAKWLIPRLSDFLDRHRDVAITLESRVQPTRFEEENFDLAIYCGLPESAGAAATVLFNKKVLPVAGRRLAEHLDLTDLDEISRVPLLHLSSLPQLWAEWFDRQKLPTENAYRGAHFDQSELIVSAAISGMGVALQPTYLMENELKTGALLPLSELPMPTEYNYYVVTPEKKQTNEAAAIFQDWLREQVQEADRHPRSHYKSVGQHSFV